MRAPVTLCAALFLALLVAIPATATPDGFLEAWFLYEQGKAKMDLAVAVGKKLYDKRQDIAERTARRDIERALKEKGRGE
mgnify:CR=1 FL=1